MLFAEILSSLGEVCPAPLQVLAVRRDLPQVFEPPCSLEMKLCV